MTEFDDLLAGLDDDNVDSGATDRDAKRQAAFEARVEKYMRAALSTKLAKNKRLKAIEFLGESGEPKAIPALVRIYSNDKDPKMRDAAEYSLGMFRSLDDAIDGTQPERDQALDLLSDIVMEGQLGRRANKRPYYVAMGLLFITFLALASVAGLMAADVISLGGTPVAQVTVAPSSTPLPPNADAVGAELRQLYNDLINDAALLQQQMQVAGRGESIDCSLTFAQPEPVNVPAGLPETEMADFTAIADPLNTARATLADLLNVFQQSCSNQTAIPRADAVTYGDTIVEVQRDLNTLSADIAPLPEDMPTTMPTEPPATENVPTEPAATDVVPTEEPATSTADVTAAPEATATVMIDTRVLQQELVSMQSIVDEMTSFRGGITILLQYWNDVEFTGSTLGCREIVPTIPDNYVLPDEIAAAAPTEMLSAVDNLNLGLDLARQAWESFTSTCARGEAALANVVEQQKVVAVTAQSALADAQSDIDAARQALR